MRFKGKKIMYIGDSLSMNNFDSLLCLLNAAAPGKTKEERKIINSHDVTTVTFQVCDLWCFNVPPLFFFFILFITFQVWPMMFNVHTLFLFFLLHFKCVAYDSRRSWGCFINLNLQDYGVEVTLFTSQFLVDIENEKIGRVIKLGSIKNGEIWKAADVLIFNNWLWWTRTGPKQP